MRVAFARAGALLAAAMAVAAPCAAQSYPTKSVRYIVPSLPGGGSDIVGRLLAAHMSQTFGQQVVVDNRAGGGDKLGYDLLRDFAPLTRLASSPLVVTTHPSLPVKTLAELVQAAKTRPGGINYASAGTGTPTYLAVESFKRRAGIDLVHVPYKGGGGAQSSILAGETQVYFANIVTAMPHVQAGRLRALAVTSPQRVPLIPDYPTIAESGYAGYQSETWFGLMLPAKTPRPVADAVRTAALAALNAPEVNKRLVDMAFIPIGDAAADFAAYIRAEIASYGKLVRELKVTAE